MRTVDFNILKNKFQHDINTYSNIDTEYLILKYAVDQKLDVNNISYDEMENKIIIDEEKENTESNLKIQKNNLDNISLISFDDKLKDIEHNIIKKNISLIMKDNNDLSMIFDNIIISDDIPFCVFNKIFKIKKNLKINENWVSETNNNIICYIYSNKHYSNIYNEKNYSIVNITKNNKTNNTEINIINSFSSMNTLSIDELIKKLLKNIQKDNIDFIKKEKLIVESIINTSLKKTPFFYSIFLDIMMNTEAKKMLQSIDNILRTQENRLIKFFYSNNQYQKNKILCKIKKLDNFNFSLQIVNIEQKDVNNIYNSLLYIINKYYYSNFEKIKNIYINEFSIDKNEFQYNINEKIKTSAELSIVPFQYLNPEIRPGNYGRSCEHIPTFYKKNKETDKLFTKPDDEEYDNYENIFIKEDQKDEDSYSYLFPKDSEEQYYIDCSKQGKYSYPGLQKNQYMCCYNNKTKSLKTIHQYETDEIEEVSSKKSMFLKKIKILKEGNSGELHTPLKKLFSLLNSDAVFYRKGVSGKAEDSILECLNNMLQMKITRKELIEKCKNKYYITQELYNTNYFNELDSYINTNKYLEPTIFYKALEKIYEVNIFLFTGYKNKCIFDTPNYTNYYYTQKNNSYENSVVIIKNYGNIDDTDANINKIIPRCEYIYELPNEQQEEPILYGNIYKNKLEKIYMYMYKPEIKNISINLELQNIKYQDIDSYGKVRYLYFTNTIHKGDIFNTNNYILVYTKPICTLNKIKLLNKNEKISIDILNIDEAIQFLKTIKQNMNEIILNLLIINNVTYITGIYFMKDFYLLIHPSKYMEKYKDYKQTMKNEYATKMITNDNFSNYDVYEKYSRYYKEYTMYLFSYLYGDKVTEYNINNLIMEFKNNFSIDEKEFKNILTKNINIKFSLDCPILKGNKLIVENLIMVNKLLYYIYLKFMENKNLLINYKNKIYLDSYYNSVNDYNITNNSLIIYSAKNVINYLTTTDNYYSLYYNIQIYKSNYFLYWKDRIYYVYKSDNLKTCNFVLDYWNKYRSINIENKNDMGMVNDYELYYLESTTSDPMKINKVINKNKIIFQYKNEDKVWYLSLCEF